MFEKGSPCILSLMEVLYCSIVHKYCCLTRPTKLWLVLGHMIYDCKVFAAPFPPPADQSTISQPFNENRAQSVIQYSGPVPCLSK
jgi:hypothetical protein